LQTSSIQLRLHLPPIGRSVGALPASVLRLHKESFNLKELRVELLRMPYAVAIVTLKNRTLSPVVEHFRKRSSIYGTSNKRKFRQMKVRSSNIAR
jgi:hypothetical protein